MKKNIATKDLVITCLLLMLLVLLIISVNNNYKKYSNAEYVYNQKIQEYKKNVLKKNDLFEKVSYLSSSYGKEKELREKYHIARPGEEVVVLLPETKESKNVTVQKNWWQKFLDFTGW